MKTTLHSGGTTFTIEYNQNGDGYEAVINGQPAHVQLLAVRDDSLTFLIDGQPRHAHLAVDGSRTLVAIEGQVYEFTQAQTQARTRQREAGRLSPEVRSPMPGKILDVLVAEGAIVEVGQALVLLEAMKMENTLSAEGNARVSKVHIAPGDLVDLGQLLVELEFVEPASTSSQTN
jgi:biotin carboxyl carrier protein